MQLKELNQYILNKYSLNFTPMLPNSRDVFILTAPGKSDFFAVLSRIRTSSNSHVLVLDVKCGQFTEIIRDLPGFSNPFRIKSDDWIGIWLEKVERSSVEKIIDYSYTLALNGEDSQIQKQYIVVPQLKKDSQKYQAQTIPERKVDSNSTLNTDSKEDIPAPIKKMRAIYDYSVLPAIGREKNFYAQAKLMEDYEDDFAQVIPFKRYYPTYHDMTLEQLRTYFTWRTKVRAGKYQATSTSYVFVYIYELLNGIGVKTPKEGLAKLIEFEQKYEGQEKELIDVYLNTWLKDYLVFYNLPTKNRFIEELKEDHNYQVLLTSEDPKKVTESILALSSYKGKYPVQKEELDKLVYLTWREILKLKNKNYDYLAKNIASKINSEVTLFNGAIFYQKVTNQSDYVIDPIRKFYFDHGRWHYEYLMPLKHTRKELNALLHELDRLLREKLRRGRKLKANNLNPLLIEAIKKAINNYYQQKLEAAKPKITIDFKNLDSIRANASVTRESLLTEEEKQLDSADLETQKGEETPINASQEIENSEFDLNEDQIFFLKALLNKKPWQAYLKQHHLMASILADEINEELFDEIGDNVIEFDENNNPQIIEDYEEDLKDLF